MNWTLKLAPLLLVTASICSAQLAPEHHLMNTSRPASSGILFDQAMSLMDASYDSQAHLLRYTHQGPSHEPMHYMVRESSWYALGLLMRDRDGSHPADAERAIQILPAILDQQFLDPSVKWYGTFKRTPEESGPIPGATAFTTYDPNWRHFIGTIFEAILIECPNRIPTALQQRMYHAIDAAVAGEMHDGRLVPSYSNIALMYGALWNFAAVHDHNAQWLHDSAAWNQAVFDLFSRYGTFNEYNAPTYYGIDLFGLALWREYGSTQHMRDMARTMEYGLWKDIATFYQPELRNLTGPYDRAYGMDMSTYVTPTGVWMRTVLPASIAPLPEHPTLDTYQISDLWLAPQITLLGTHVSANTIATLSHFTGPRFVDRTIDDQRRATAWIGHNAIWGGEFTSLTKDTGNKTQFHPVDIQWRLPANQPGGSQIAWIELTKSPTIDAVADQRGLSITTHGDVTFRIFTGATTPAPTQASWPLPSLAVTIHSDASGFTTQHPATCTTCTDVTYKDVHTMRLDIQPGN